MRIIGKADATRPVRGRAYEPAFLRHGEFSLARGLHHVNRTGAVVGVRPELGIRASAPGGSPGVLSGALPPNEGDMGLKGLP